MPSGLIAVVVLILALQAQEPPRLHVTGVVLRVDKAAGTLMVSHESIAGYMGAMVMPFNVCNREMFDGLQPGMKVEFALVIRHEDSCIENLRVLSFESLGQHPLQARRLQLMESLVAPTQGIVGPRAGQTVPDFTLIDQRRRRITLSKLRGRVVALNFVYTRCPLPDYCVRLSNNFGQLQKRFARRMGRDLVLLSVTFDPEHDQPAVLAKYANTWKADPRNWHFLTGSPREVRRICRLFDVGSWADEGLLSHSLHTAIIDQDGKLVVNIDGNQFTVQELGDLVEAEMEHLGK